ncbi:AraC family transcriptional regulator [Sciscionella marina]|uniref:AraC family transcriptional regulator n=1 Tax=Sciscionella marina TaxID=508770 RepID=UPI0003699A9C|nr:helix-turn-helix transcriptional regulator [Sciscionella marina]
MYGKSEDRDDYQDIPRPVGGMARDLPDRHYIPPHAHRRDQLIYGASGAITVISTEGTWVVPPQRAVWVPAGVEHATRTCGPVPMRTLYIEPSAQAAPPTRCMVISVSPLARELIIACTRMPTEYEESGRDGKVVSLLLDELVPAPVLPLHLPMPHNPGLARLCTRIMAEPQQEWTFAESARIAHLSERTLARRFRAETGWSLGRWRQQARLLTAVQLLAGGNTIGMTASLLGYHSPSAFTAMFRKTLGVAPSQYFAA